MNYKYIPFKYKSVSFRIDLNPDLAPSIHPLQNPIFCFLSLRLTFSNSNSDANTIAMRKGAKRKTKHTDDSQPDSQPVASSQENENKITKPKAKRLKTSKPHSEPEYFEDKRNLVRYSTLNYIVNVIIVFLCFY